MSGKWKFRRNRLWNRNPDHVAQRRQTAVPGHIQGAIRADYDAALKIDPKLATSLYGRGVARIGRGDRAGGNEDVAAARKLNPDIQALFARYGIR